MAPGSCYLKHVPLAGFGSHWLQHSLQSMKRGVKWSNHCRYLQLTYGIATHGMAWGKWYVCPSALIERLLLHCSGVDGSLIPLNALASS